MPRPDRAVRWLACGLLLWTVAAAAAGQHPIAREIARVRSEAAASVPAERVPAIAARLDRAASAAERGDYYLSLYHLQPAFEMQAAFASAASAGVKTLEQFTGAWTAAGEPRPAAPDRRRRPLFVEALAQTSEGQASATYHASRPYAEDAGVEAGAYYLGESHAFGKFAAFSRSLDLAPAGAAPALRSLAPELSALEAEVLNAYDKAEGTARQPFIVISVTMKQARSLDRDGRRAGALLQYLLTRYRFALTMPAASASASDLAPRITAARAAVAAGDHSVLEFFLQLAESLAGSADTARNAAAILDAVIPAYWAVIR